MKINVIAAVDEDNGIGRNGKLPWHISEDLKRFKELTLGKPIIMGRKTFESLKNPLPDRINIVVNSSLFGFENNAFWAYSLERALGYCNFNRFEEIFIIGGSSLFNSAVVIADTMYLTKVKGTHSCDVFFNGLNYDNWNLVSESKVMSSNGLKYSFLKYNKK